jgi:polycomb protein EED
MPVNRNSIRFYNDLVISRAAKENTIQIWQIDHFNSDLPTPPSTSAPVPSTTNSTISAFGGRFQRLLTLDTPSCSLFYMRFGFFHQPQKHPVLVMGNEKSRFFVWDLQLLGESGQGSYPASAADPQGFKKPALKPQKRGPGRTSLVDAHSGSVSGSSTGGKIGGAPGSAATSGREESIASTESGGVNGPAVPEKTSVIRDSFKPISAHKTFTVSKVNFASRAISWSPGGEWCVAAGDNGMICLFRRW